MTSTGKPGEQQLSPKNQQSGADGTARRDGSLHPAAPMPRTRAPATVGTRNSGARVRLQRINANLAKVYPPAGQTKEWWTRLKAALGTASSDFVNGTLAQIQNASRLPGGGISETGVNAVLAFIEGAKPRNEVEAALATEMACVHAATMTLLSQVGMSGGFGSTRHNDTVVTSLTKLTKSFAQQAETLHHLKHGASQNIRVEHVNVHSGAQAVVGNLRPKD